MKFFFPVFLFLLGFEQSHSQDFTQSELPIIVINTDEEIPDEPKINGQMGIIFNGDGVLNFTDDPFTEWNGNIGIETRGNSTQGFDKKTYSIELKNSAFQDSSSSLLGMGKEEDWILHAMVIDKSQLRIPMCFDFSRQMGHYASHYKYCELVLNGEYRGLYILCEKIKRDDDRVDIAKLDSDDLDGDSLTGGYILRIDWPDYSNGFESEYQSIGDYNMFYKYYYPKGENIQPEQEIYIKGFMDEFEDAVFSPDYHNDLGNRYNDYIQINSFTDFLLINEFSKNSDGYKLSSYLHKDRDDNGGLLNAGPIWDFDQTFGLSLVCSSHLTHGWTYTQEQPGCEDTFYMPAWWQEMMSDTVFTNHLACRWSDFRQSFLHLDSIYQTIDNHVANLSNALNRNFERWEFIGESIWIEPYPIPQSYEAEVEAYKNWIAERLIWMDENLPGNCENDIITSVADTEQDQFNLYPNPANSFVNLIIPQSCQLMVYNLEGKLLINKRVSQGREMILTRDFQPGLVIFNFITEEGKYSKKLIIEH